MASYIIGIVKGSRPLRVLIDTGAISANYITNDALEELKPSLGCRDIKQINGMVTLGDNSTTIHVTRAAKL